MLTVAAAAVPLPIRLPTPLAASGTCKPADQVRRPLEATIAVLRSRQQTAVIITVDLLYVGRALRSSVEQLVRPHVRPDQLIMAASHTHYAPPTDLDKPALGAADAEWVEEVARLLAGETLRLVAQNGQVVAVRHGIGATDVAVNRRRNRLFVANRSEFRWRTTAMAPNPKGYVDRGIHLVEFRHHGALVAVLWSMACHPVSLYCSTAVDAHYVGFVRQFLRERNGDAHLPVLFLQGFAGDCRPDVPYQARSLRGMVERLATGAGFGPFPSGAAEEAWMERLAGDVGDIRCEPATGAVLRTSRRTVPRARFVTSASSSPVSFAGLRIGSLNLIGGSAEFVGEYRPLVLGDTASSTVTAGYFDDVFGYAPTAAMLPRGGYEVSGFCSRFGVDRVGPGIESAVRLGFAAVQADLRDEAPLGEGTRLRAAGNDGPGADS